MVNRRGSVFREALQVSPELIRALDDASLNEMMRELLLAQAYRCGADPTQVRVNTEGQAKDDGCDGWSPMPAANDLWLDGVDTCWQFKRMFTPKKSTFGSHNLWNFKTVFVLQPTFFS